MKINLLLILIILLGTFAWTIYSDNRMHKKKYTTAQISLQQFDDFKFITLQGKKENLYAFKGQPMLIHFWATWCAPCIEELPQLIALSQRDNIKILAFAVNDEVTAIQRFIKKNKLTLPTHFIIGLDPDTEISKEIFNTHKLPETYIIDNTATLIEKIIGAEENWLSDDWQVKLKRNI